MLISVEVINEGSHVRDIKVTQGTNSLSVNLMHWWDVLTGKNCVEYFPPESLEMVGDYKSTFSLSPDQVNFPIYGKEETEDYRATIKDGINLGYSYPVIKGRRRHEIKTWSVYNDGEVRFPEY